MLPGSLLADGPFSTAASNSERETLDHYRNETLSWDPFPHIDEVQIGKGNLVHTRDAEIGGEYLPNNPTDVLLKYEQAGTISDRKSTRLNSSHVAISYAV